MRASLRVGQRQGPVRGAARLCRRQRRLELGRGRQRVAARQGEEARTDDGRGAGHARGLGQVALDRHVDAQLPHPSEAAGGVRRHGRARGVRVCGREGADRDAKVGSEAAGRGGRVNGPALDGRGCRRQLELARGAAARERKRREQADLGVRPVSSDHSEATRDRTEERAAAGIVGVLAQDFDAARHPKRGSRRRVRHALRLQALGGCCKELRLGRGVGGAHAARNQSCGDGTVLRIAQRVSHGRLAERQGRQQRRRRHVFAPPRRR